MDRYFATLENGKVLLTADAEYHLLKVRRGKPGDEIEAVVGGKTYAAIVSSLAPLSINILHEKSESKELGSDLYLAFSLLKGGHDELAIEKCTELGARGFYPFISRYTIKTPSDSAKLLSREKDIALNASEQSKRTKIPEVFPLRKLVEIADLPYERKYLAYEALSSSAPSFYSEIKNLKASESVLLAVGPEGGFSPEEAESLKEKGFVFVSLGERILRSETALIYAASVFSSVIGERK